MQSDPARLDVRLVPAALTAWAVTAAGIALELGYWLAGLCAMVGLLGWTAAKARRRSSALVAAGLGAAVVGTGFGIAVALRCDAVHAHPITHRFGTTTSVAIRANETPRNAGPGRLMFRAHLTRLDQDDAAGEVVVFAKGVDFGLLVAGQPARLRARLSRPSRRDLTVAVLTAVDRPTLGSPPVLQRLARSVRDRFAASARATLPAEQAAILPGLVLGDTTAVTPTATTEFRTAGLTHLTAVSGANVSIVCAAVLLSAYLIGPRPAVALAAVTLAGFVIVVEPTASVLRAAVMAAIGLLAMVSGRRRQAVPVLAATVIALMLVAPQLAVDLGFALSVFATAALILVAPGWSAKLVGSGWPKPIADALSVALAAQLATAPLIAAISGKFSVVSLLANLAVAPVIPAITVFGTAAAVLVCLVPTLAGVLIRFTGPEVWWLLQIAHAAARLPGAALPVPAGWSGLVVVGVGSVAAAVLWRLRWFRMGAGVATLSAAAWSVSILVAGA